MQNKWTASVTKKTEDKTSQQPEKNNSKKIGLVMGIVGAVLVTAGAAPMLFGNSENLTGDATNTQQEAVDPLVALLSGGNETAKETKPSTTVKPTPTTKIKATIKPTKKPKATVKPTKISTSDKTVKVTNTNTKKTDKTGENFHNASALVNTSNGNIKAQNGNQSASITGNTITATNGSQSVTVQTSAKTTIKPLRNIQTGFDINMMLGLLFLIASGALLIRSRKTA
jgi:flagellar basal body-associated protein FliL